MFVGITTARREGFSGNNTLVNTSERSCACDDFL